MKQIIFTLAVCLFLSSCEHEETRLMYVCDCQQQAQASQFIKESIAPANNMSDEEMEDVISQLERTAVRLHCTQQYKKVRTGNGLFEVIDAKEGQTVYNY
jgi:hypothetical protein